ncbi:MAG TPA: S-methyl-5'-thioadenosine phosphorylase [bacterium]|nr:S-methyl-5'-thioadenosine phosphorylase [bacterium]HPJ71099.1 S-methyl-5'-thioadenosine phosphorylase [bacterium]HPQ65438.1 S-methyl-5'-thioadenosine phosphorylase [bacterium]
MSAIGIIGGSGLYEMEGLGGRKEVVLHTPFGEPSDAYTTGEIEGNRVVFLPRHGNGHRLLPSEINYAANIWGFKKLGVERIISVTAVGSLREDFAPQNVVLPDQYFDRMMNDRRSTFFGEGVVAHVSMAEPSCPVLLELLFAVATELGAVVHKGGTYLNMEGPAFSTRAESNVYRQWGMDIIGMTNLAEARLAREAEICYQSLAMVTDYDCWHPDHEHVTLEMVIRNLSQNTALAKEIIKTAVPRIPGVRDCLCSRALENSIVTAPDAIPPAQRHRLDLIIGRYL